MQQPDHQSRTLRAFAPALVLLAISFLINYVDRGNLSVALSSIEKDIHLGKDQLGVLGMAFFVSYSFLQIFAGKLIDRYNVIWVYALGYLVWSGATALTGLVHGFQLEYLEWHPCSSDLHD